jgi:hypothetical protein
MMQKQARSRTSSWGLGSNAAAEVHSADVCWASSHPGMQQQQPYTLPTPIPTLSQPTLIAHSLLFHTQMPAVPTNMDTMMLRRLAKGTSYQGCMSQGQG